MRNQPSIKGSHQQVGSALVIAIFVLVVFTLLALALVRILSSSSESVVYEVLGTRAYSAAQTGANWQMMHLFPHQGTAALSCAQLNALARPDISLVDGLQNCQILSTQCQSLVDQGTTFYTLESVGECSTGEVTTSRTVRVDARSVN